MPRAAVGGVWRNVRTVDLRFVVLALPMLPTCRTISGLLKECRTASREQVRGWWGRGTNVLAQVIDRHPHLQEHVVNGPFTSVLIAAVGAGAVYLILDESLLSVYPSGVAETHLEEDQ